MFTWRNFVVSFLILCAVAVALIMNQVRAADDLTPKEARKLVANLAGIKLPSDAVRVKEIETFGNSATVTAQIETAFRLVKGDKGWRVAEIRTGDRRWEDVDMLVRALDVEKAARVHAELETIATALESFRRERGFYIESTSEAVLIDHLHPHYLASVIRVDPWHQPYEYEGMHASFVLRSTGPDGKSNTSDDIIVSSSQR